MDFYTGYRVLHIREVRETNPVSDRILINFHNSDISLDVAKDFLAEKGLNNIKAGDYIAVKGRKGNQDHQLWMFDVLEDMRLA